jgi:hypothetical protein
MKSGTMLKTLAVCAVSSLPLISGTSLAASCASPAATMSAAPFISADGPGQGQPMMNPIEARLAGEMARIDQGLRMGQITPYQAGRLMREAWEKAQFQRGFLGAGQETKGSQGCGLNQDLVAALAPIVANMAKGGIQTASTVMRALAQEVSQFIREQEQAEDLPPL